MVIDLFFEFYVLVSEKLKIDPNLKGLVWLGSGLDKIKIRFSGSGILKTRVFGVGSGSGFFGVFLHSAHYS